MPNSDAVAFFVVAFPVTTFSFSRLFFVANRTLELNQ